MDNSSPMMHRYAGRYRAKIVRDGAVVKDTGWFHNVITDQGMDYLGYIPGSSQYVQLYCSVGTGNTAPSTSDTTLASQLNTSPALGNINNHPTNSYVPGPPAYYSTITTYTFPVGGTTGNIAELGVGPLNSPANPMLLFSRALIVDGSGNPTTITVLSNEQLVVYYELRCYIDLTDHSYSCTISGVTYSGIWRAALTGLTYPVGYSYSYYSSSIQYLVDPSISYFNGAIGPVTGGPSGSQGPIAGNYTVTHTPYVAGSYYSTAQVNIPTGECNFSPGLSAGQSRPYSGIISAACGPFYQWSISPVIPKTADDLLSQSFSYSWARYP